MKLQRLNTTAALTLALGLLSSGVAHAQGEPSAPATQARPLPAMPVIHSHPASPLPVNIAQIPHTLTNNTYSFTVSTTSDPTSCPDSGGDLSLRCAISVVDVLPRATAKMITFGIPATDPGCAPQTINAQSVTVCTIKPAGNLPAVTAYGTTINGYTQAGSKANSNLIGSGDNAILTVQLDGSLYSGGNGTALQLAGTHDTAEGLSITNFGYENANAASFGYGIDVVGSSDTVSGDFLAVTPAGALGFIGTGIFVEGPVTTVGGSTVAARNVISGNDAFREGYGIAISSNGTSSIVEGNLIGTTPSGAAMPNNVGVIVGSNANNVKVGGPVSADRNVISGNTGDGVELAGFSALVQGNYIGVNAAGTGALGNGTQASFGNSGITVFYGPGDVISHNVISTNAYDGIDLDGSGGTTIQGNDIGTNAAGTAALGNTNDGIGESSSGAASTFIGGNTTAVRNVISGNGANGVELYGGNSNIVAGNYIGVSSAKASLRNALNGVYLHDGEQGAIVGATTAGAGNIIANNGGNGVLIGSSASDSSTTADSVRGNSIYNNPLGISLNSEFPAYCTSGSAVGAAPNDYLPCPIIIAASTTSVTGTGYPSSTIDVYVASSVPADSGHGEGKVFLGTTTSDSSGNWSLALATGKVAKGQQVTATVTNGSLHPTPETSEFSANVTVS